jgi:hypothetical protein
VVLGAASGEVGKGDYNLKANVKGVRGRILF